MWTFLHMPHLQLTFMQRTSRSYIKTPNATCKPFHGQDRIFGGAVVSSPQENVTCTDTKNHPFV
jgi:phenylalanine-4-hydroxylase